MTTGSLRRILLCSIMLGMAISGPALADGAPQAGNGPKWCEFQGTWFGVTSPTDLTLTGWVVTVEGKSHDTGTNNLEFPTFDPTLGGKAGAVRISTLRGAWERTGRNTFVYSFTGFGLDNANLIAYIATVSGTIRLSRDCRTETINASMALYAPNVSPFTGSPFHTEDLAKHYGYRY
jgi:hypothetical protein